MHPLPHADLAHVLERAEPIWRALRGARLFITGGTGFFGGWLLESVAAANAALGSRILATVLSRDPHGFRRKAPHLAACEAFEWHAGDVRDFDFPSGAFTHVLHAGTAASAVLNAGQPDEMFGTIVSGTRRVLEFAHACGAADMLHVSSGAVYGRQPPDLERIPESWTGGPDCLDAANAYAEGKRAAEMLCAVAAQAGAVRPRIARCFAFVGPRLPLEAHFAAGNFLRDALHDRAIAVGGDGTPYRSYLHASDLIVWLLTILVRGAPLRPYNVGSDEAVSIAELAGRVARLASSPVEVSIRQPASGLPAQRYIPSIERARGELGLEVWVGLDAALRRTFAWLKT